MESYSSLLEAFESLNERKRNNPRSLSEGEMEHWKELRREIETVLFQRDPGPEAENREFLRVPVALSVRYWTRDELKDRYIPILGEGGLFVSAVDPLDVGSELDLEIVLARKGLSFAVKGRVVWVNKGPDPARRGMGIKFADLTYEQKRNIYGLVDDNLRQHLLERRKFARVAARLMVNFVYAEGFFELRTEDLSLGGMFIATEHLVPVGEKVRMVLHVAGDRPAVRAIGTVVRVVEHTRGGKPAGLGIQFTHMDPDSTKTIREFLAARVSGQDKPALGERRSHPRVERMIKLRFQSVDSFGTTMALDISTGGVFIQTHDPAPLGSAIQVTLIHPVTLGRLDLVGKVVRVVEPDPDKPEQVPGVGVAFDDLSPENSQLLREFLQDFTLLHNEQLD